MSGNVPQDNRIQIQELERRVKVLEDAKSFLPWLSRTRLAVLFWCVIGLVSLVQWFTPIPFGRWLTNSELDQVQLQRMGWAEGATVWGEVFNHTSGTINHVRIRFEVKNPDGSTLFDRILDADCYIRPKSSAHVEWFTNPTVALPGYTTSYTVTAVRVRWFE